MIRQSNIVFVRAANGRPYEDVQNSLVGATIGRPFSRRFDAGEQCSPLRRERVGFPEASHASFGGSEQTPALRFSAYRFFTRKRRRDMALALKGMSG